MAMNKMKLPHKTKQSASQDPPPLLSRRITFIIYIIFNLTILATCSYYLQLNFKHDTNIWNTSTNRNPGSFARSNILSPIRHFGKEE